MPTEQKIDIVKQATERFKKSSGIYFTKYTGIDVQYVHVCDMYPFFELLRL